MNRIQRAAKERDRIRSQAPSLADLIGKMSRAKAEGKDPYSVTVPPHLRTKTKARAEVSRGRAKSQPENEVKNACLRWLKNHGIYAFRQNTGMVWAGSHPVRFGTPGAGDITGLMPDGRRLEIECKSASGKQSDTQKRFEELMRRNNGIYLLVYSAADLEEGLRAEGYTFDPGHGSTG